MGEHTSLPWYVDVGCSERIAYIYPENGNPRPIVAQVLLGIFPGKAAGSANAEFIVRAVNSHEDALEACRLIIRAYENADAAPEALDRAYAAIAKAERGES